MCGKAQSFAFTISVHIHLNERKVYRLNRFISKTALKFAKALHFDRRMSDDNYLRLMFKVQMGRDLNLKNPRTFNEKLQWLKLHNHDPLYTTMVDKHRVKQWVADRIGEQYVTPTYAVWEQAEDIDVSDLPNRFVLKTNHDSGSVAICRNKSSFDLESARKKFYKSLKRNYYWQCREWPYKNVKPLVFAEEYIDSTGSEGLSDYKFMCFNGRPDCVMLCTERETGNPKFLFFDRDWRLMRYNIRSLSLPSSYSVDPPPALEEMFSLAEVLSYGLSFVRVDLYSIGSSIRFGEMTFFPQGGFDANLLPGADLRWGEMIDLPQIE